MNRSRCIALWFVYLVAPVVLLADDAKELTSKQRREMEEHAAELKTKADQFYLSRQFAEAIQSTNEAIKIWQQLYPKDKYPQGHPEIAQGLNRLGFFYQARGQIASAETTFRDAVQMNEALYPKDKYPQGHRELAQSIDNLASMVRARGQSPEAETLFRSSLEMRQRLYPKDKYPQGHPDLAQTLNSLGLTLLEQGQSTKAEPFYREALEMRQQLYPKDKYPQGHADLAQSLNNLGYLFWIRGEHAKAEPFYRDALQMNRQLYPGAKYPAGHPDLAQSLNNLAALYYATGQYANSEALYREALLMRQQLYPPEQFPQGHPDVAAILGNLSLLFQAQGEYEKAEPLMYDALKMWRQLYPKDKYPQGHPHLIRSLANLTNVLQLQGEYAKAESFARESLQMSQQLYPKEKFPSGHPDLARSLQNLGILLQQQHQYVAAEPFYRDALQMRQQLYSKDKFPHGHPDLASSLNMLGHLLEEQREFAKAESCYRDALQMRQQLYPKDKYPQGHPDIAQSLNSMGYSFWVRGDCDKAEPFYRESLEMYQQLFPKDKYPYGHPDLSYALIGLAASFRDREEYAKAEPLFREALQMQQSRFLRLADIASEAETLNFATAEFLVLDSFLSTTRHLPNSEGAYPFVWECKGSITKIQMRRHLDLLATTDEESKALGRELLQTRQALARLLLSAPRDALEHARAVQQLTDTKEDLEKRLANRLRLRLPAAEKSSPDQLRKALPANTAFIDVIRYYETVLAPDEAGERRRKHRLQYAAFIVQPGEEIARVELGEAAVIEQAWKNWHAALTRGAPDRDAALAMARFVWLPLRAKLSQKIQTVWLSPDGALNSVPWAALPGAQPETVLLEEHAVAVVPNGAFLLQRLRATPPNANQGVLLAVGGVAFDQLPEKVGRPREEAMSRAPAIGDKQLLWKRLEGTDRERQQIVALARKALPTEPIDRSASAATTAQMLADLPRVRYAHLATHGFFAGPEFRSVLQVDEKYFAQPGRERTTAGTRNPLVLSGLVFAGANQADTPDRGILTAEAIVGLRLDDLDLAVLSACDSGLGAVAGGEGTCGLQRAFHIAGTHNVVASLWKVDDDSTAALMVLFYRNLWVEKMPPLEALRQAQLHLYRHPEQITGLAKTRGVDFSEKELPKLVADPAVKEAHAHASKWAAFVLSGDGR